VTTLLCIINTKAEDLIMTNSSVSMYVRFNSTSKWSTVLFTQT